MGPEEVIVTGSRLERPAADAAQSVDVLTRADFEARQVANVTELLRQVAGMNVIQQGGRGGVTSVVLRGAEPNFTVVLIDGIKVNDSTNTRGGSYDFSYLDLASIERVEIVRGPMSAVYGSDALAGVINIITRAPQDSVEFRAEAGGHGLEAAGLSLGGSVGAASVAISVHALNEDGDIEGASYEDRGADGSLILAIGDGGEAGLMLRYQDADSAGFPEDSGGPEFAVIRDVDTRSVDEAHARAYLDHRIGSDWRSSVSLSRYDRSEAYSSPGIAPGVFDGVPPNSADTDFVRDQLSISVARDLGADATVVLGGEWQDERGDSTGFLDFGFPVPTDFSLDRDTLSAFGEIEVKRDSLTLQGSLRWDDPDGIDSETSAQFGAIYALAGSGGALRLNIGEAFKAPSFFALAHPLVGNPDLVSETATSYDIGYRRGAGASGSFEVSVYRNEFENLIDFDPELFTNVNRSEVVTEGVEFTSRIELSPSIDVDLNLTYSEADIRDSDARLRGRPRWRGGLIIDWHINEQWQFAASLLVLDEFYEVSIPTGGLFLDGYERLDLALSYQANERLRLGLAIDNSLNAEYYEAVGFPAAGVRGRVNFSYRL